jgi:triosephosphate isomerase (TIM)
MRTPVIAGNWKMNMTVSQSIELVKGIYLGLKFPGEVDVIVSPPFTALYAVANALKNSYIAVAAQNLYWEDKGAFTGEISPVFIKDAGADYVIIGHSERRQYFGETDETVNKKIKAVLNHNLVPIVCVGETLEERESGQLDYIIKKQIVDGLKDLSEQEVNDIILAYEPVWAIGTGKTATPEQAEEVHAKIRHLVAERVSQTTAENVRILYGGSMKPSNAKELLSKPNIDGGLIGGAALKPEDFIDIIKSI